MYRKFDVTENLEPQTGQRTRIRQEEGSFEITAGYRGQKPAAPRENLSTGF